MRTQYFKKEVRYGAGHPQLPSKFAVTGTDAQIRNFFDDHETTDAIFIPIDGRTISKEDKEYLKFNAHFDCRL